MIKVFPTLHVVQVLQFFPWAIKLLCAKQNIAVLDLVLIALAFIVCNVCVNAKQHCHCLHDSGILKMTDK